MDLRKSQKKILSGLKGAVKCILGWIAYHSSKVIKDSARKKWVSFYEQ